MKFSRFLPVVFCLVLCACHDRVPNSNLQLSLDYYQQLHNPSFAINSHDIRDLMDSLMRHDSDRNSSDLRTRSYYGNEGGFVWIDRYGVDQRADTLLSFLRRVTDMGFGQRPFYVRAIEQDLRRIRTLDLDSGNNQINRVMARLEYRLTKSYLRYVAGQRFGFVNPTYVLNRLDSIEPSPYDTVRHDVRYRGLYDVKIDHVNNLFYSLALRMAKSDSIAQFLHEVQPTDPFYYQLESRLAQEKIGKAERAKILSNMERCRWRQSDTPYDHKKYVVVNIPSFHLMCIDHADTLTMRIGCGSFKTKTPLLSSHINCMEINPKWIIPHSILVKDIVRHVGNPEYFYSHNYFATERATGKEIDPRYLTRQMLLSGDYGVAQRGGNGNALGRIIFRFNNNFSVFLHDTSSRGVFSREDRGVSHGCVRVEKPYDLAVFLLKDKDEQIMEKIKYSMTADSLGNPKMVIGSLKVNPPIPLFITYYTMYPMSGGRVEEYPDVYGYDEVIYSLLKKYFLNKR